MAEAVAPAQVEVVVAATVAVAGRVVRSCCGSRAAVAATTRTMTSANNENGHRFLKSGTDKSSGTSVVRDMQWFHKISSPL